MMVKGKSREAGKWGIREELRTSSSSPIFSRREERKGEGDVLTSSYHFLEKKERKPGDRCA